MLSIDIKMLPVKIGEQRTLTKHIIQGIDRSKLILAIPFLKESNSGRECIFINSAHQGTGCFSHWGCCEWDRIRDEACYRFVDRQPCTTTGQYSLRVGVVSKNGGEVKRNSSISMQQPEVSVATREGNTSAHFWEASQHTQISRLHWLTGDVNRANASRAHSHEMAYLA